MMWRKVDMKYTLIDVVKKKRRYNRRRIKALKEDAMCQIGIFFVEVVKLINLVKRALKKNGKGGKKNAS